MSKFKIKTLVLSLPLLAALSTAAFAAGFSDAQTKTFAASPKSDYLAGTHQKMGLQCVSCHPSEVTDGEKEINQKCTSCHGDLDALATKTQSQNPNPHKSHLGKIQCTACHSGHEPSVAYCTNCHDFPSMKTMKQGKGANQPNFKEDLAKYDNAAPTKVEKTQLLVVGSGAAGFVAAMTARDAGIKDIIMIEKMAIPGGNSQLAAGGMNAAGTKFQKEKGIEDNPELMFKDTMKGGKNASNPDLAKILAEQSNASIEWLAQKGAVLSNVGRGGGSSAARMHGPAGGAFVGPYLSKFFRDKAEETGLDLRLNSKLVKLITDKSGNVVGALVKGKHSGIYRIDAKAVILATGGIGANADLVQALRSDISKDIKTSNQPGSQGDGMLLAQKIGADVVDVKEIQLNPTLLVGSPVIVSEIVRGAGAVFVNKEGKRFISELTTRDVTSAAVSKQTGGVAYEIFDQGIRDKVKQLGAAFELGLAKEGNSLAELAKNTGINPDNLVKTIEQYNKYADSGKDPDFNRPGISVKIGQPKYYAIEITPAIHYYMGGLKIDKNSRVVNKDGKPINGLFAAGEVTGGVHGKNRLGGNSISETITFGRIAGQSAAELIQK
ncbi:flavocytochrome c [Turicimonas sp. TL08]